MLQEINILGGGRYGFLEFWCGWWLWLWWCNYTFRFILITLGTTHRLIAGVCQAFL